MLARFCRSTGPGKPVSAPEEQRTHAAREALKPGPAGHTHDGVQSRLAGRAAFVQARRRRRRRRRRIPNAHPRPVVDGMPRKWSAPSARAARQIPPAPHPPTRPAAAHRPRDTEGRRPALRGGGALIPSAPGGLGSRPAGAAAADDTQRCMLSWAGRRFRPPYPERRCPPGPGRCSRSRRCRCRCGTGGARAA